MFMFIFWMAMVFRGILWCCILIRTKSGDVLLSTSSLFLCPRTLAIGTLIGWVQEPVRYLNFLEMDHMLF